MVTENLPAVLGIASTAWAAKHVLGPSLDAVGEVLRELTEFQMRNVRRIIEAAAQHTKDDDSQEFIVPTRTLLTTIDYGAFVDDEVMAEYLGGVLAGSRTTNQWDDRGAYWAALIARMSSIQVRTHYLVYSTIRKLLLGDPRDVRDGENLGKCQVSLPLAEYAAVMGVDNVEASSLAVHSIVGLGREDLLGMNWVVDDPRDLDEVRRRARASSLLGWKYWDEDEPRMVMQPQVIGVELFYWAHGQGGGDLSRFLHPSEPIDYEPSPFMVNLDAARVRGVD